MIGTSQFDSNCWLKEEAAMARLQYLQRQIELAERLARSALDALTIERLQAYADGCRRELRQVVRGT
jgi:hypothetical protein